MLGGEKGIKEQGVKAAQFTVLTPCAMRREKQKRIEHGAESIA